MEIESKITGSALTASEFNQIPDEMENLINKSGQTASSSDLTQITKAVSQFVADGDFYSTSGTANAIILSAVSPRLAPTQLTNGFRARFIAQSDNTDTVTININNLGAKQVKFNGNSLGAGDLVSGKFYEVVYVASDDSLDLRTIDTASLLNKKMITNCILEAPNGVATYSGSTITIKSGLKVLIPNGRNADGTLNNIEYITSNDNIYTEQTPRSSNEVITIAIDNQGRISTYIEYYAQENNPNRPYTCWYKPSENNFYTSDGLSNFSLARITPILLYKSTNLQISTLIPYQPINLLKRSDKSEISGWGMPSNRYIDLTLGASDTKYTAPANGWFACRGMTSSSNNNFVAFMKTDDFFSLQRQLVGYTNNMLALIFPALKGEDILFGYMNMRDLSLRFYYSDGVPSA